MPQASFENCCLYRRSSPNDELHHPGESVQLRCTHGSGCSERKWRTYEGTIKLGLYVKIPKALSGWMALIAT